MKNVLKIIGVVAVIAIIALVAVKFLSNKAPESNLGETENSEELSTNIENSDESSQNTENSEELFANIENAEGLSKIIDDVYAAQTMEMPMLQTQEIDVTDNDMVSYVTGLENGEDLEYAVASEPMMSSQAYSFVLAKVKDGVNANEIAKKMCDNIDARKWICVTAEKVYATSSGNVVCLVMSNEETAKPIYEKFKELAGKVGQEFEKTAEEPELPADMY